MNETGIEIDEKIVEKLKRMIIIQENNNLKKREKSDPEMVKWIMKKIEEEVKYVARINKASEFSSISQGNN